MFELEDILRNDENFREGLGALLDTELEPILFDKDDDFNTIWGLFESASENQGLMKTLNKYSTNLLSVLNAKGVKEELKQVTSAVFPLQDKETGLKDAPLNAYYSPYIALALYCKLLPPQIDDKYRLWFNPRGSVTVGEFFDSLNAIYKGYNANENRHTSLDNVSYDTDYFNEGYNRVVTTFANPIYALYGRKDFLRPITRLEVAYILFFGLHLLSTETNYIDNDKIGITYDWLNETEDILHTEEENKELKVSVLKDGSLFDFKSYLQDDFVEDYIKAVRQGTSYVALPLIASLIELGISGVMYNDDTLNPLDDLSRGELVYIMFNVTNILYSKKEED